MQVIPAINAKNFDELKEQLLFIEGSLPEYGGLIHLDVTDGEYSTYSLWNNPSELKNLESRIQNLEHRFEVHLMIKNPELVIDQWLQPCVGRVVFHPEASENPEEVIRKCREGGVEVMISLAPHVSVESVDHLVSLTKGVQILTVIPGAPGQGFGEGSIEKIYTLRKLFPNVILEVDGGINTETAKRVKEVGANIVVSASYIMKSSDPGGAYRELMNV